MSTGGLVKGEGCIVGNRVREWVCIEELMK